MGLDIVSSDGKKCFHITYSNFAHMRGLFGAYYDESIYKRYISFEHVDESEIGNLNILLGHSDCDGLLTTDECKLLKECLFVDESLVKKLTPSYDYYIKRMYEFIDLVNYCADNPKITLDFG